MVTTRTDMEIIIGDSWSEHLRIEWDRFDKQACVSFDNGYDTKDVAIMDISDMRDLIASLQDMVQMAERAKQNDGY